MLSTRPPVPLLRAGPSNPDRDRPSFPEVPAWVPIPAGFLAGFLPWSDLVVRRTTGMGRRGGGGARTGSVDGAGIAPVAIAGMLDMAKGAVGPLLAGRNRPALAAAAAAAAMIGHSSSPWSRRAERLGLGAALGALGVTAPAASVTLLGGMAAGRLMGRSTLGSLIAALVAVPVARQTSGPQGGLAAACVVIPLLISHVAGHPHRAQRVGATSV